MQMTMCPLKYLPADSWSSVFNNFYLWTSKILFSSSLKMQVPLREITHPEPTISFPTGEARRREVFWVLERGYRAQGKEDKDLRQTWPPSQSANKQPSWYTTSTHDRLKHMRPHPMQDKPGCGLEVGWPFTYPPYQNTFDGKKDVGNNYFWIINIMGTCISWKNPEEGFSLRPLWAGTEAFPFWFLFFVYFFLVCYLGLLWRASQRDTNFPNLEFMTSKTSGPTTEQFLCASCRRDKGRASWGAGHRLAPSSSTERSPCSFENAHLFCRQCQSQGQHVGMARALPLLPVISWHPCPPGDRGGSSLRCPQEESVYDFIFSTAEGSVVQKSSRLSHPTPNLVRYHVLNTHIHNTLSDAHTHTSTFSDTRSPCSPKLPEPTVRGRGQTPSEVHEVGPSLHSRLHSAKSEEGGSHSTADSPSEWDPAKWDPAVMTPLFWVPGSTPPSPHILEVGVGGHKGLWITATPKTKGGERYQLSLSRVHEYKTS